MPADPDGQPLAVVFKTIADPFVGQVSLLKVLSGTIRNDDHLVNSRTGADERLHGLFVVRGKEHEPVDALAAGDIGGVAKLSATATGDTLAPKGQPVHVAPIEQPAPVLATAVVAKTQADDDKLASALHRLQDEDPALVVDRDEETHQTVLRGTGETHLAITLERLERKFGVNLTTEDVRVRYRETITEPAEAEGRHKKQSGGHGQFAVATIRLEPLERGAGFEFVDKIVGGAVSRAYIPAVAKGIEEAMARGRRQRPPGRRRAGHAARRQGAQRRQLGDGVPGRRAGSPSARRWPRPAPVVLEPIARLDVTVPSDLLGDVMGDLNVPAGQGAGHRAGRRRRAGRSTPSRRRASCCATPSTCGRSPAGGAASPSPTTTTTCCPRHLVDRVAGRARRRLTPTDRWPPVRPATPSSPCARSAAAGEACSPASARTSRPTTSPTGPAPTAGRRSTTPCTPPARSRCSGGPSSRPWWTTTPCSTRPSATRPARRGTARPPASVDDALDELAHEADRLADRVEHVPADEWQRRARVAGQDADVGPLEVLWDAVDTAVADLKAAEATLREVRGRP